MSMEIRCHSYALIAGVRWEMNAKHFYFFSCLRSILYVPEKVWPSFCPIQTYKVMELTAYRYYSYPCADIDA